MLQLCRVPPPPLHGLPLGAPRRAEAWLDLGQASALGRGGEKEQLQGLNDRFAGYIERVRQLEQQNRLLEAELAALRQRQAEPSRLGELFRGELRQLRAQLEEAGAGQAQAAREREQLAGEVQRLRARCEQEARGRAEAEQRARAQQQEADGAARARLGLEKRVEALREELAFLRQVHEEELAELAAALQAAQVSVEPDLAKPDLSSALREIRAQYESLAAKNLQAGLLQKPLKSMERLPNAEPIEIRPSVSFAWFGKDANLNSPDSQQNIVCFSSFYYAEALVMLKKLVRLQHLVNLNDQP
uniref:IF rod domain-containing protein n=1 Tax=Gopherus agassizii TaxID=38772 RepID=A0A452J1D5_9SAUR